MRKTVFLESFLMEEEVMKYNLKIALYIGILISSINMFSQENKDNIPLSDQYILFEGDTLLIELDEVMLLKAIKFKKTYDKQYYYWFRKKVFKAYPYAKLAADRLDIVNKRRDSIKSRSKRRDYTIRVQKYLEGELTEQLKKLTRTEGRILIKLIHRQTGATAYDNIKDVRSGWNAFWYNATASMFKLSLKDEYEPEFVDEDFLIEDILQRAFVDGTLDYQATKLNFKYQNMMAKEIVIPPPPVVKKKK